MALRTSDGLVIDNLKGDYATGSTLDRPIKIAHLIVERMKACATRKGMSFTCEELLEIETQLASHYYTRTDRLYKSRMTDRASGTWLYNAKNPEPYLANALELDFTGCLNAILNQKRAGLDWLGKDDPEKLDYIDRNGT